MPHIRPSYSIKIALKCVYVHRRRLFLKHVIHHFPLARTVRTHSIPTIIQRRHLLNIIFIYVHRFSGCTLYVYEASTMGQKPETILVPSSFRDKRQSRMQRAFMKYLLFFLSSPMFSFGCLVRLVSNVKHARVLCVVLNNKTESPRSLSTKTSLTPRVFQIQRFIKIFILFVRWSFFGKRQTRRKKRKMCQGPNEPFSRVCLRIAPYVLT